MLYLKHLKCYLTPAVAVVENFGLVLIMILLVMLCSNLDASDRYAGYDFKMS